MNRRKFVAIAGTTIVIAGVTYYLSSDTNNFVRADYKPIENNTIPFKQDEREILFLASLAPSGHNTQPWFVKYLEPYHWIIGNDKAKWLPAVDPSQRETILSIGAFLQNLEYAANNLGYNCQVNLLATTNQDENVVDVYLVKSSLFIKFDSQKIKQRRTVRSNYLSDVINKEDLNYIMSGETDFLHYINNISPAHILLNENTIEANKIQSYRDAAQEELANWIRFSSNDAKEHADGLTTAGMEIDGVPGWILRNFYKKSSVLKKDFRDQGVEKVRKQVAQSAGWILITSKGNSVLTLLESGKRMQRLFLRIRDKNIAIHPMTQILEEPATNQLLNKSIGIADNIQFILRTGYLKNYPNPVSLRRPVETFVRV